MRHIWIFGLVALATACVVKAEVKPTSSDDGDPPASCADTATHCSGPSAATACYGGSEVSFACPGGCAAGTDGDACDFSGSLAGDPCPDGVAPTLCDATGKARLSCVSGKWTSDPCDEACSMKAGIASCVSAAEADGGFDQDAGADASDQDAGDAGGDAATDGG